MGWPNIFGHNILQDVGAGFVFLLFLLGAVGLTFGSLKGAQQKDLIIDDEGIHYLIGRKKILKTEFRWDEIESARSYLQPSSIPSGEGGVSTVFNPGIIISGKNRQLRIDIDDFGPEDKLKQSFRAIAERLAKNGIYVDDGTGWARDIVLYHKYDREEIGPIPEYERKWCREENKKGLMGRIPKVVNVILFIVLLVLIFVLVVLDNLDPVFTFTSVMIFWIIIIGIEVVHLGHSLTALWFDDKKMVLRFLRGPDINLDWPHISMIKTWNDTDRIIILTKEGKDYDGSFQQDVRDALLGRFAFELYKKKQSNCPPD